MEAGILTENPILYVFVPVLPDLSCWLNQSDAKCGECNDTKRVCLCVATVNEAVLSVLGAFGSKSDCYVLLSTGPRPTRRALGLGSSLVAALLALGLLVELTDAKSDLGLSSSMISSIGSSHSCSPVVLMGT